MKPLDLPNNKQMLLPPPVPEVENSFIQAAKEDEKDLFFVVPDPVNDPAQWDEGWFASYE